MWGTCRPRCSRIVLIGLSFLPRLAPYFVRGGLYLGSTFLLYVSDASWMQAVPPIPMTYHILFGAMAVMVLLSMRFDSQSRFQTTPLDYLMVCLAVIFPFLPEVRTDISAFGLFAAKLIVLFFSFELLLHAFSDRVKQLGLVSLWMLFGLGDPDVAVREKVGELKEGREVSEEKS